MGALDEVPSDVASLAAAPEEQVLKLWEGLGYYPGAESAEGGSNPGQNHEGHFPRTAHLFELPGIGRYTAGAIASIAFNEPAAILDGNVIRVLTRQAALSGDPRSRALNVSLWSLAGDLVSAASEIPYRPSRSLRFSGSCSVLNQSLMELGATICTPRDPACSGMPGRHSLPAFQTHAVDAYPTPAVRRAPVTVRRAVAVVEGKGRFPSPAASPGGASMPGTGSFRNGTFATAVPRTRSSPRTGSP